MDRIEDILLTHAESLYGQMEDALGRETMAEIESRLMLQAIDTNWVQHLTAMENLRQGIGLYAYGQRDPLVMYKKQGMEQFQNLQGKIQSDIAHMVFRIPIELWADYQRASSVCAPAQGGRGPAALPRDRSIQSRERGKAFGHARHCRQKGRQKSAVPMRQRQEVQALPRRIRIGYRT